MEEAIYLQTDSTFSQVRDAIVELQQAGRLVEGIRQGARIRLIQRALEEEEDEEEEEEEEEDEEEQEPESPKFQWRSVNDFARTAGACFRMAMMEATGINRRYWPRIDSFQQNTREANMSHTDRPFCLADNRREANRYSSKYKMLYESNDIIQKYRGTAAGANVPLNSVMVIFRNNEMIKIITVVHLQKRVDKFYHASVRVLCEKYVIAQGDDAQLPAFRELRALPRNVDVMIHEAIQQMDELRI